MTTTPPPPNPDDAGGQPGRPDRLTPQRTAQIVAAILAGNFRYVAAAAVGVRPRTLRGWMRAGELYPRGRYGDLRRAVLAAEADAERRAVAAIIAAAQGDAKHLEWWLERKFPQRWGRGRGELVELLREVRELRAEIADLRGAAGETPEQPAEA